MIYIRIFIVYCFVVIERLFLVPFTGIKPSDTQKVMTNDHYKRVHLKRMILIVFFSGVILTIKYIIWLLQ